jgi:hypothetical protein
VYVVTQLEVLAPYSATIGMKLEISYGAEAELKYPVFQRPIKYSV